MDNRIDAEDIRFCQTHQTAYAQSLSFLSHLAQEVAEFHKMQAEILGEVSEAAWLPYFLQKLTENDIWAQMDYARNVHS